jgi:peptide/nickel transport system substrate-binding protein
MTMTFNRRDVLALSAAAMAASIQPTRAQGPKVLKVAPHASLRVLDPVTTNAYITRNHGYMVYDTLFAMDADYRPQPQMVGDWSVSDDKLTYSFVLRDGLAFHDGAPVTAEDCIASITRWSKRDLVGGRLAAQVVSMTAVDAKTFKVVLKESFGQILSAFAKPSSIPLFVMPKRIAETSADKPIDEVVGSGPFRFVAAEFRPGVRAVYERNPAYRPRPEPASALAGGKVVKVDRVEWITFPDRQTAINALQKGEIDLIETINADSKSQLVGAPNVVIRKKFSTNASTIRFNWAQPPFDNEKIRQAVQQAVTQGDYLDTTIGDADSYKLCGALFGCGTPLESDAGVVDKGKPDLARAKALLKEGGYKGERIVMITPGDVASFSGLAPLTQQVLRSIGMNSEIQTMEWSTYLSRRTLQTPAAEGGWNLAFAVWDSIDLISPLANLNFDARGKAAYTGFVDDPETEQLKNQFARETDPARQKALAEQIQKRAYERVFYIPLGTYFDYTPHRSTVSGIVDSPIVVLWGLDKA